MLRANLATAREEGREGSSPQAEAGTQELKEELEQARKRVAEVQETGALFKEQQVAAVQAAAGAQKQVPPPSTPSCLSPQGHDPAIYLWRRPWKPQPALRSR